MSQISTQISLELAYLNPALSVLPYASKYIPGFYYL